MACGAQKCVDAVNERSGVATTAGTGEGSAAGTKLAFQVRTEGNNTYKFFPTSNGYIRFTVQAANDAYVCLSYAEQAAPPIYEIKLGIEKNAKSSISKDTEEVHVKETPSLLSGSQAKGFWIRWGNKMVVVGRDGETSPFMIHIDRERMPIHYVGFCTANGSTGDWKVDDEDSPPPNPPREMIGSRWVYAKFGKIPPNAVQGGEEEGKISYVARVFTDDGVIPGKILKDDERAAYPEKDENELSHSSEYQVLCGFKGKWVAASNGDVPEGAFVGGRLFDGNDLYVCRANHKGHLVPGCVQKDDKMCYVSYSMQTLHYPVYEVLCRK